MSKRKLTRGALTLALAVPLVLTTIPIAAASNGLCWNLAT